MSVNSIILFYLKIMFGKNAFPHYIGNHELHIVMNLTRS